MKNIAQSCHILLLEEMDHLEYRNPCKLRSKGPQRDIKDLNGIFIHINASTVSKSHHIHILEILLMEVKSQTTTWNM